MLYPPESLPSLQRPIFVGTQTRIVHNSDTPLSSSSSGYAGSELEDCSLQDMTASQMVPPDVFMEEIHADPKFFLGEISFGVNSCNLYPLDLLHLWNSTFVSKLSITSVIK